MSQPLRAQSPPARARHADPGKHQTGKGSEPPNSALKPHPNQPFFVHSRPSSAAQDSLEPAFKRQKLDANGNSLPFTLNGGGPTSVSPDGNFQSLAPKPTGGFRGISAKLNKDAVAIEGQFLRKSSQGPTAPPFPHRPTRALTTRDANEASTSATRGRSARGEVQIRAYVTEPPSSAPRYHRDHDGPADFRPWTGDHPEDILNELSTKQGFYGKTQVSQNEINTARPSVWSSLKHKSGLQVLSSLFVSALKQRQNHNTMIARCAFKPPPRVTLTDSKREAWLRDLANSSIPLRRLSRTIPHGIRGKALLDHCLAKNIPLYRAVWLAKCVGANEIRAFRRKGTAGAFSVGGEAKWVRDWTANVQQFVDGILVECGFPDWRPRIDYALRLASYLFSEHLLDQDRYLEWVTKSLRDSDLNVLPLWLTITQAYWSDSCRYRQNGKHLAEAMLFQLRKMVEGEARQIYSAVIEQLLEIIKTAMSTSPESFLLPQCWIDCEDTLREVLSNDGQDFVTFQDLASRNWRLMADRTKEIMSSSPCTDLIHVLDGALEDADLGHFAEECSKNVPDQDLLVTTCVEWASDMYECGLARVYVAVRLCRRWSKQGIGIDRPILNLLGSNPSATRFDLSKLFKVIAELVCSKHFSVGRYLQWLMARGTLTRSITLDRTCPCEVRLLHEIPLHGLPSPLLNLRSILLASGNPSLVSINEDAQILAVKSALIARLPILLPASEPPPNNEPTMLETRLLRQTIKSAIGRWIRQSIISRIRPKPLLSEARIPESLRESEDLGRIHPVITLDNFVVLREILEDLGEFAILADVLGIIADSQEILVMTAVLDAVHSHFGIFKAIGAVPDLFRRISHQQVKLSSVPALSYDFSQSLLDLGRRIPGTELEVERLRKIIKSTWQRTSIVACSPLSEGTTDNDLIKGTGFVEEMDQILTSSPSLDKRHQSQLFRKVTTHLETGSADPPKSLTRAANLLLRLRPFGPDTFDLLRQEWLHKLIHDGGHELLPKLGPVLINAKFATLKGLLTPATATSNPALAVEALRLLVSSGDGSIPSSYRLNDQRDRLLNKSPKVAALLLKATTLACLGAGGLSTTARHLMLDPGVPDLIRKIATSRISGSSQNFHDALEPGISVLEVQVALERALYPYNACPPLSHPVMLNKNEIIDQDLPPCDTHAQLSKLFHTLSDLNIYMCQLQLKIIVAKSTAASTEVCAAILDEFLATLEGANESYIGLWRDLVSALPPELALDLSGKAEHSFLSTFRLDGSLDPNMKPILLKALRATTEATSNLASHGALSRIQQIRRRLSSFLLSRSSSDEPNIQQENPTAELASLYISSLLLLLIIHQGTLRHPDCPQTTLSQLSILLSRLMIYFLHLGQVALPEYIFDVLSILSDCLSEDSRTRYIDIMRSKYGITDPRLVALFGRSEDSGHAWHYLATGSTPPVRSESERKRLPGGPSSKIHKPFPLRRWEMMQDATPTRTETDTSLSLTLFGARQAIL